MSKCSVWSVLKLNCSHWTLFLPKYWAWAAGVRTRNSNAKTTIVFSSRIDFTSKMASGDSCKLAAGLGRGRRSTTGDVWTFKRGLLSEELERVAPGAVANAVEHPHHAHW